MATERQRRLKRALTALIPRAPFIDAEAIREAARSRHMRSLSPESAIWLSTVAHIRHQHTDYDELMDEGYDKDAARFFVLDDTNAVLDEWGATRRLDPEAVDEEPPTERRGIAEDDDRGDDDGPDDPWRHDD